MSQKLKEHKCLLAQIKPITEKTPWKKVSELSPCPLDETEPSTPQTTSTISTRGPNKESTNTTDPPGKGDNATSGTSKIVLANTVMLLALILLFTTIVVFSLFY